jgi:hypothetical protein
MESQPGPLTSTDENRFIHFVVFPTHFLENNRMPVGVPLRGRNVILSCPTPQAEFLDQINIRGASGGRGDAGNHG